jgi:hypothetical protein
VLADENVCIGNHCPKQQEKRTSVVVPISHALQSSTNIDEELTSQDLQVGSLVYLVDGEEKFLAYPGKMVFWRDGSGNNHQSSSTTPQEVLHLLLLNIVEVASFLLRQTYRRPLHLAQPICISFRI